MTYKVGLVSLGCAKNLVDSEMMLGILESKDFSIVEESNEADIIIVNTCGFIDDAKIESIDTILSLSKYKIDGKLKTLIATGCLSERYRETLMGEIPELDAVIGTGDYGDIISVIERTLQGEKVISYGNTEIAFDESLPRKRTTPHYTTFVKIGDGCNNHCTYCIIPTLRGKFRSRKKEDIIREVKELVEDNVKEIIIIAQDITQYGTDIYEDGYLHTLLKELDNIDGIKWIRLLYVYPENIDDNLINTIKKSKHILPYLDIPIQHTEDAILKKMARRTTKSSIINLINKLRTEIPNIIIRSSFITGFPGETDVEFENMLDTIKDLEIDRLGVFTYSMEEGTRAATFDNQIDEDIKIYRQDKILNMQQEISSMKNKSYIGSNLDILIEGQSDENNYYGRSYMDAPEIDGMVYVHSTTPLNPGDFCTTRIIDALEYDLIGENNNEYTK